MMPMWAGRLYHHCAPFQVTSGYGLFRRMTGVGQYTQPPSGGTEFSSAWAPLPVSVVARPEIELEGYDENEEVWRAIPFAYKPGDVYGTLPQVAPHQPRLDWQMWFAALGSYQVNPLYPIASVETHNLSKKF